MFSLKIAKLDAKSIQKKFHPVSTCGTNAQSTQKGKKNL